VIEEGRVAFRRAVVGDVEQLADIQFREPSHEATAMAGSAAAARNFQSRLLGRALADGTAEVIVLELDGTPAAFAELSNGGDVPSFGVVARCAIESMGVHGALAAGWRALARNAVDFPSQQGLHLVELQVAPEHRNSGLGGRLLSEVEGIARERLAPRLSLTTAIENPARRLYERHGFHVESEKRHRRYEAITGNRGRVLMVKPLAC